MNPRFGGVPPLLHITCHQQASEDFALAHVAQSCLSKKTLQKLWEDDLEGFPSRVNANMVGVTIFAAAFLAFRTGVTSELCLPGGIPDAEQLGVEQNRSRAFL